ncbi:MAG: glycoside hydrolase family 10 protein [Gemmatimonadaceae bacterium]
MQSALCGVASLLLATPALMAQSPSVAAPIPAVEREFRGVWVASVSNIDWPSLRGLPSRQQQEELRTILDRAAEIGLNAVILQVRPATDALYASSIEPWSEYLTGEMGRAPEPFYDPLAFAIEEAHARGLELHAWFNPFRARHPSARSAVAPDHVSRTHPEFVRRYGAHLWLDPGDPAARAYSTRVILDVVRRYDVDAVHLDDYFYPYRERDSTGALIDFPDDPTFERYRRSGGTLGRHDWRRSNVDAFVEQLYAAVKAEKPYVKVGISPFGIWRPGNPAQVKGFDAYEQIYADSRKWLRNGWVDYFAPQLYWPISQPAQSYTALLAWWTEQNLAGRHLWPGNFTSRIESGDARSWPAGEVLEQIRSTRAEAGATGNIHFSMKALIHDRGGIADSLQQTLYSNPALVPATPWIDSVAPARPELRVWPRQSGPAAGEITITFKPGDSEEPRLWVVRSLTGHVPSLELIPGWRRSATVYGAPGRIAISAVDGLGNESAVRSASVP